MSSLLALLMEAFPLCCHFHEFPSSRNAGLSICCCSHSLLLAANQCNHPSCGFDSHTASSVFRVDMNLSAGNLKDKCGHAFDPEVLGAFATWGLLESLELVHKPLVQDRADDAWEFVVGFWIPCVRFVSVDVKM